jgi:hypothetical protein
MLNSIIEDKRPIVSIGLADEYVSVNGYADVGITQIIDNIVPYYENGEMAGVIWFAIYSEGDIVRRVNGKFVESIYY